MLHLGLGRVTVCKPWYFTELSITIKLSVLALAIKDLYGTDKKLQLNNSVLNGRV
jgi:hypothetical protein